MDSSNLYTTWKHICDHVKTYKDVNSVQVDAFFGRLEPQAISDGFLAITADTEFIKVQVEKRFLSVIQQALRDLFGIDYIVEIEVNPVTSTSQASVTPSVSQDTLPTNPSSQIQGMHSESETSPLLSHSTLQSEQQSCATLSRSPTNPYDQQVSQEKNWHQSNTNPETNHSSEQTTNTSEVSDTTTPASPLTFENFVIGDSNRLAYSMAVAVAETPGKPNLNPLFIYGKSGLGKTHLLRAIQNYILETNPSMHVVYIDSSEFLSDYTSAVAAHDKHKDSYQNFQKRYLDADVFLIDDVQYFQGKSATVDIVFQLFNKLTAQGHQVVLSADRAPKMIDIDERYKSRFNSGGTVDIQPPEMETKLGIIKGFIEEYKYAENNYDIYIPEEIRTYIAEISSSNVRELKSAITKVIAQITYFNNPNITLAEVKELLENHFSSGLTRRTSVGMIQKEVEQFYRVSHADLIGSKRSRNIMYARQVAIYLCRRILDIPYNDIGKKFNRDHSTVMYSVEKIERRLRESRELEEELEIIIKNIREN